MAGPETQLGIALLKEIPGLRISTHYHDLFSYSRDMWPLLQIRVSLRRELPQAGVVVWPRDTEEVQKIYRFAQSRKVPVTPVGGLSGVCGGAVPEEGGIQIDLKGLDTEFALKEEDRIVEVGVGWIGTHLEREVNKRGYTVGHFPSSLMCSTVGGWIATRGAGQMSSLYGKVEDRVMGVEWVTPKGDRYSLKRCGPSSGLVELLLGSEGTLGAITKAYLKVDPFPENRRFRAYRFPSVADALEAIRTIFQEGITPAVVRLYDPLDTWLMRSLISGKESPSPPSFRLFPSLSPLKEFLVRKSFSLLFQQVGVLQKIWEVKNKEVITIFVMEGEEERVEWEEEELKILLTKDGEDLGEEPAKRWFSRRYAVSFKQIPIFLEGGVVDTMEVAFPWSTLYEGYCAVRKVVQGECLILAHFSHFYPTGGSIYFTFIGFPPKGVDPEDYYREMWRRGLDAVLPLEGTVAHHHGIGLQKAKFMWGEWGGGYGYLKKLKQSLDPERIANPGKQGL